MPMESVLPGLTESSDHRGPEGAPREGETAPVDDSREARRAASSAPAGYEVPHARNTPHLRREKNRQFHAEVISGTSGGSPRAYAAVEETSARSQASAGSGMQPGLANEACDVVTGVRVGR
ncbi:hypothetical protein GN244_ATG08871 [Phytophthora infestans]|uniref:Uncharacterized protein n=1 Tax=Phytophthora infestans TaxID=4787 RepID=A0A833T7Y7_PHYIN|nr:hypothetical protein GN244_ATG08871 [Phytophthora infestans]KAF4143576.1 hypothetical protein GN958_ATG07309 [Phytophthora infestans]